MEPAKVGVHKRIQGWVEGLVQPGLHQEAEPVSDDKIRSQRRHHDVQVFPKVVIISRELRDQPRENSHTNGSQERHPNAGDYRAPESGT